ncbi:MAG: helix-turn-helix domain-containing protein [Oscillospiraceae bacterium]|jgi:transcriptional regulator with XRE-family HTH domain|nr:helix-turn-helix domain-containing protein [Oscillospiraceae bacterium]
MPVIDVKATGNNIKNIIRSKGFRIADVQARCGFNTPQAIFKWMRGDAVPSIDNLIILADMFDMPIDGIIIVNRI